ncbi:hypothetical protein Ppa06_27520 [Planomonospora parontospora subsp. parontospora]|uniref:Transposase putative helix-turn-helix domain-containing protein n=2 Tax=Planomonospora parontospora TaxID=58119 RepID=A0AA37F4W2_9ACTN|nr:helix-turn-helix domain-containing protein [Planomonospora parontospora]GGK69085.1 hypothetical protein GCM10010126_30660 [Planomonospora parontospora]GII08954.1 hypothetical protein Ppa06_27520 [Planomonospora parontospora subsp. parontospora]
MLTGRRYRLEFDAGQRLLAERVAAVCRAVWNTALEQRRVYRARGAFVGYAEQCRQLAEAKKGLSLAGRSTHAGAAAGTQGPGRGVPAAWHLEGPLEDPGPLAAVVPVPHPQADPGPDDQPPVGAGVPAEIRLGALPAVAAAGRGGGARTSPPRPRTD